MITRIQLMTEMPVRPNLNEGRILGEGLSGVNVNEL